MTDIHCSYGGDREATLIAYLYDEMDPAERAAFDAHVAECARCRSELAALGRVRRQLTAWDPPAFNAQGSTLKSQERWRIPAWAQAAAAVLILGVAVGAANLDVRYDANGLTIRSGWMKRSEQVQPKPDATSVAATSAVASKSDLTALEQQLRREIRAAQASAPAAAVIRNASTGDADTLRKLRAIVDESERRQNRELALRVAQVVTDLEAQRQADLRKIDTTLNGVQRSLGVEVLKQQERVNYLMRVNQRQ